MLTDPQSITDGGTTVSLPKIEQAKNRSVYRSADGNYVFEVSHSEVAPKGNTSARFRTLVKVVKRAVVPDPLTSVNDYETLGVHIVMDRPDAGFTATNVDNLVQALKAWLTTATVTKLYGLES